MFEASPIGRWVRRNGVGSIPCNVFIIYAKVARTQAEGSRMRELLKATATAYCVLVQCRMRARLSKYVGILVLLPIA